MSSIRKKIGSPYWFACYTLPDGRQTQNSTKLEAKPKNAEKARSIAMELEKISKSARSGIITVCMLREATARIIKTVGLDPIELVKTKDFLLDWINSKQVTKAKGTSMRYKHTVESFLLHLGERQMLGMEAIRPKDIETFRNLQIKEGKSPATANMVVKTLRIPFNLARRQGVISVNPAEAVDMLPAESGERRTFSREQIYSLLEAGDEEWKGMILFGVCHGLRIGDAARLTWANIDMERQSLRFYPQKTSKGEKRREEEYPLHPDILEYLGSLPIRSKKSNDFLFPKLAKKTVSGDSGLSLSFRKLMHQAGIVAEGEDHQRKKGKGRRFFELGFHSLRHTAISEQANRGIDREIRMKLSGHRSAVHERYTHHELSTLRQQIEKVPSFMQHQSNKI